MKAGGGGRKGGAFERRTCVWLSKMMTGGERADVFWRSSMSGGRATVQHKRGIVNLTQQGDISGIDPLADKLLCFATIECKHVKNLAIEQGILTKSGALYRFWGQALRDASRVKKQPILIAMQNRTPILFITTQLVVLKLGLNQITPRAQLEWRLRPIVFLQSQIKGFNL